MKESNTIQILIVIKSLDVLAAGNVLDVKTNHMGERSLINGVTHTQVYSEVSVNLFRKWLAQVFNREA